MTAKGNTDMTPERLTTISRMFSSTVIREMARKGRSQLFARLAQQSLLLPDLSNSSETVSSLFEFAFSILKRRGFRDEYVYKAALTQNVLLGRHNLRSASMVTEFRVGECKADVVILNGTGTVYEVKSERDSLSRLERQIAAYVKVFAAVNVIAAECHVDAVTDLVPEDVGVLCLDRRNHITAKREAVERPDRTSPSAIFDCLRTDEARRILISQNVCVPQVPNTEISRALRELFIKLEPNVAHRGMVDVLRKTRNLLPLSQLIEQLPPSLQAAALSLPLRRVDHSRLVAAVNTRLDDALAWI
jgi:hypothetical protein